MGRMLGAFDDDVELDRPDLNKCPDCNCFFAGDNCPICGKVCPEHMRAGNRAPVKPQKKKKRSSGSGRVTFVEWYHSWWFIVIMMFLFPIVGIVLLITSPHDRSKKILFVTIAAIYLVISTIGLGTIISGVVGLFDKPVDTSLSKEDYIAACEEMSAESFYRAADSSKDKFVCIKLRVVERVDYIDDYYNSSRDVYYLCEAPDGSSYKIIVRDCLIDSKINLIDGDVITVYGEADERIYVYETDGDYTEWFGPCVNMAYVLVG